MRDYSDSRWRNHAAPIIAKVLLEHAGEDYRTVRAELRKVYPFGVTEGHPYKIWLDEIKVQTGKKRHARDRGPAAKARIAVQAADETVGNLFAEEAPE